MGGGGACIYIVMCITELTLMKEAIYPVDTGTLMMASQEKKVLFVLYLVC